MTLDKALVLTKAERHRLWNELELLKPSKEFPMLRELLACLREDGARR